MERVPTEPQLGNGWYFLREILYCWMTIINLIVVWKIVQLFWVLFISTVFEYQVKQGYIPASLNDTQAFMLGLMIMLVFPRRSALHRIIYDVFR